MAKKPAKTSRETAVEYIHTPDSIEVTRNAKGEYSHKIKIYLDTDEGKDKKPSDAAIKEIGKIDTALRKKFRY
jgi:hypothetical protein